jgi:hypothetical protein
MIQEKHSIPIVTDERNPLVFFFFFSVLLNYAARRDFHPLFVDLDIGQGSISIPGMLSAVTIEAPLRIGVCDVVTQGSFL